MGHDELLQILRGLAAGHDGIAVKGARNRYCATGGNMFAFIDPVNPVLCLRLSEAAKRAFNAAHGGSDVIQYGAVMRGYVAVPEAMLADKAALGALFAEAVDHARSLPEKPTTRKKK